MTKPTQVTTATRLLWATLLMGLLVKIPLDWSYILSKGSIGFFIFVTSSAFAFMALLIWKISQGKNWARIIFAVLFLLGALPTIIFAKAALLRSVASGLVSILQAAIQAVALIMLFTRPGKIWFSRKSIDFR